MGNCPLSPGPAARGGELLERFGLRISGRKSLGLNILEARWIGRGVKSLPLCPETSKKRTAWTRDLRSFLCGEEAHLPEFGHFSARDPEKPDFFSHVGGRSIARRGSGCYRLLAGCIALQPGCAEGPPMTTSLHRGVWSNLALAALGICFAPGAVVAQTSRALPCGPCSQPTMKSWSIAVVCSHRTRVTWEYFPACTRR